MTVVDRCVRTWRRLGVAKSDAEAMEAELVMDLAEANDAGVSEESFVGGDAEGFARGWASARGVIRPRWRLLSTALVAAVGALPGAAVAALLPLAVTSPWFIEMVQPNNPSLRCARDSCAQPYLEVTNWLLLWYVVAFGVAVAGVLLTTSAWLRRCADPARRRTVRTIGWFGVPAVVVLALVLEPYDQWLTEWRLNRVGPELPQWYTILTVGTFGVLVACRWWAVRRSRIMPDSDAPAHDVPATV